MSIVEADNKFSRNISVGQIVVERPDRKTVKEVHVEIFTVCIWSHAIFFLNKF